MAKSWQVGAATRHGKRPCRLAQTLEHRANLRLAGALQEKQQRRLQTRIGRLKILLAINICSRSAKKKLSEPPVFGRLAERRWVRFLLIRWPWELLETIPNWP